MKALLALEDGRTFPCSSFTGSGEATGELVFNTSMTGYQEVLTDPSYRGQMVVMTYPLVGNYGINPEDIESERIQVAAFIIKEYQPYPSNFRVHEHPGRLPEVPGDSGSRATRYPRPHPAYPQCRSHAGGRIHGGVGSWIPGGTCQQDSNYGGTGSHPAGDDHNALLLVRRAAGGISEGVTSGQ